MITRPLSRDEVRSIDARAAGELGLPTIALMENAGRGAADLLAELAGPPLRRVAILCGPGNNGGDGAVVARHLDARGVLVDVLYFADVRRLSGDAAVQHEVLVRAGLRPSENPGELAVDESLRAADWVVDGLLGTGLAREVEGPLRELIERVNRGGRPVMSLDLPSGLDCDTGRPLGVAVRATVTATFVGPKLGFSAPGASDYTGQVHVLPIGVPRVLLEGLI